MAQFLLAVHSTSADYETPIEEMMPTFEAVDRFNNQLQADGHWVFAGGLEAIENASVVDGTADAPVVTDGPYVESKEYLGGFWVIDVPDLATAQRIAAEGSKACQGKVEVRPFQGE